MRLQANKLLELVQPEIIWGGAISLFIEDKQDAIGVIDSLIDVLRCDEETQQFHLPNLLSQLLNGIENIGSKGDFEQMYSCLLLARKVFGKFSGISTNLSESQGGSINIDLIKKLKGLYQALLSYQNIVARVHEKYIIPHFPPKTDKGLSYDPLDETQEQRRKIGVLAIELLVSLFIYLPNLDVNPSNEKKNNNEDNDNLNHPDNNSVKPPVWLITLRDCAKSSDPKIVCTSLKAFVELLSVPNSGLTNDKKEQLDLEVYFEEAAGCLWNLLDSKFSSLHFQTTLIFHDLLKLSKKKMNEIINSFLSVSDPNEKVEACKKFGILWKLINDRTDSNPLATNVFSMVDTLSDQQPKIRLSGRTWLTECIPKAERVLEPLLKILLDPNIIRHDNIYIVPFDTRKIVYVLNLFRDIISCDFIFIPSKPVKPSNFTDITVLHNQQEEHANQSKNPEFCISPINVNTWIEYFLIAVLRFTITFASNSSSSLKDQNHENFEFYEGVGTLQSTAAGIIRYFLTKIPDKLLIRTISIAIQPYIAHTLFYAVEINDFVFQVQLLRLLKIIISSIEETKTIQSSSSSISLSQSNHLSFCVIHSPQFIQTLTNGLQQPLSGSVRYYWVEFINTLISYYAKDLKLFVTPISRCLCDIIFKIENIYAFQLSIEILVILDSLSNIMSACLLRSEKELSSASATISSSEKSSTGVGILGTMVRSVFSADEPQSIDPIIEIRKELLSSLPTILKVFIFIWNQNPQGEDEIQNKFNIQDRVTRILESIFINFSNELIYGFCSLIDDIRKNHPNELTPTFDVITDILNAIDTNTITPTVVFNDCALIVSTILKTKATLATSQKKSVDIL